MPLLVGGGITAFLSAAPYTRAGNCFCCMWKLGGGFLAAYLYYIACQKNIKTHQGFLVGLYAGLVATLFEIIFQSLLYIFSDTSILFPSMNFQMHNIPDAMRDRIIDFIQLFPQRWLLFQIFGILFTDVVFLSLGGLICGAIFSTSGEGPSARIGPAHQIEPVEDTSPREDSGNQKNRPSQNS